MRNQSDSEADQHVCFRFIEIIVQFVFFPNLQFQASGHLLWPIDRFVSDLIENPEDRFSRDAAQM